MPQPSSSRDTLCAADTHSAELSTHIHEMAGSLRLRILARVLWDVLLQIILHIFCQEVGREVDLFVQVIQVCLHDRQMLSLRCSPAAGQLPACLPAHASRGDTAASTSATASSSPGWVPGSAEARQQPACVGCLCLALQKMVWGLASTSLACSARASLAANAPRGTPAAPERSPDGWHPWPCPG